MEYSLFYSIHEQISAGILCLTRVGSAKIFETLR